MPSMADCVFIAILGVQLFTPLSVRLLGDAGIGWHIRTGQQILATHAVPHVDPFSSVMGGKPWFAWEWFYDLMVGQLDAWWGLNGVVWLTAVVVAGVFATMFRFIILRGANALVALFLMLLATLGSTIHLLARPHVFGWLLALIWFWILESSERESVAGNRGRRLWLLPILMLAWVNLHGSFLLGFALLAIFWMGAFWDWYAARADRIEESLQKIAAAKRARQLTGIGLLSLLASFINPYGWKLHAHIYSYLTNRFLMDHVEEFQSPNFHGVAQRCFAVLLIITIAALVLRGRRLRVSEGLTVLFAVYSALYSTRNIPVSSILIAIVIAPLLWPEQTQRPNSGPITGFANRVTTIEQGQTGHVWCLVGALITLAICANEGRVGSRVLMNAHFGERVPAGAVDYLEKNQVAGPVLTPDVWGGYVIYRMYPKIKVVFDDRHDFYGEQYVKAYLKSVRGEEGWQKFLDDSKPGCVLLPKDTALASLLSQSDRWKSIYADEKTVLFVPR